MLGMRQQAYRESAVVSVVRLSKDCCVVVSRLGCIKVSVLRVPLNIINLEDTLQDRGAKYDVVRVASNALSLVAQAEVSR